MKYRLSLRAKESPREKGNGQAHNPVKTVLLARAKDFKGNVGFVVNSATQPRTALRKVRVKDKRANPENPQENQEDLKEHAGSAVHPGTDPGSAPKRSAQTHSLG